MNLWLPDKKAKSRAMFLGEELKMIRKAPLDQGKKTLEEQREEMVGLTKIVNPRQRKAAIRKENENFFERMVGDEDNNTQ